MKRRPLGPNRIIRRRFLGIQALQAYPKSAILLVRMFAWLKLKHRFEFLQYQVEQNLKFQFHKALRHFLGNHVF
jgi:hypothetical protein